MSNAHVPAEPKWRRLPEERPQQILEAALEVFGEHGLSDARLEDIAKRAGVSKGTIYLYFPNKEELFRDVVRTHVVARIERAEHEVEAHPGTAAEQLEHFLRSWWTFLQLPTSGTIYRLVIGELHRFPDLAEFYAKEVVQRALTLLSGFVRRGIDAGEFRDVDPFTTARIMSSMFISHAVWCHKREVFRHITQGPAEQVIEDLIDFIRHALKPTIPPKARARTVKHSS
jgi:AcrR family transcriptional regulator